MVKDLFPDWYLVIRGSRFNTDTDQYTPTNVDPAHNPPPDPSSFSVTDNRLREWASTTARSDLEALMYPREHQQLADPNQHMHPLGHQQIVNPNQRMLPTTKQWFVFWTPSLIRPENSLPIEMLRRGNRDLAAFRGYMSVIGRWKNPPPLNGEAITQATDSTKDWKLMGGSPIKTVLLSTMLLLLPPLTLTYHFAYWDVLIGLCCL